MSNAVKAGLCGGLGVFQVGLGLEGLLEHVLKTQTLVEAYLAKVNPVDTGAVNDAYMFADNCLGFGNMMSLTSFAVGSLLLGMAVYNLAKSYERKE